MSNPKEVDDSRLRIHPFELSRTLSEADWSQILGSAGFGWKLLERMQTLAPGWFEFSALQWAQEGRGGALCFELDGAAHRIELTYNPTLTATLLSATRQVIDGVNQALKSTQIRFRFALERRTCTGNRSCYRLLLAPRAWLAELGRSMNLIAGISPEDYERTMLAPKHTPPLSPPSPTNPTQTHARH